VIQQFLGKARGARRDRAAGCSQRSDEIALRRSRNDDPSSRFNLGGVPGT
jgi:hypothetical protein